MPVTPPPSYDAYKFYLDIVVLLGVLGNTGYTWWSNREKVTSRRFAALENEVSERVKLADLKEIRAQRDKKCEEHKNDMKDFTSGNTNRLGDAEKKIERIGAEIRNLPQHRHIQDLSGRIDLLHGDVHEVAGSLKGISRAVDLMNEFLINRGK